MTRQAFGVPPATVLAGLVVAGFVAAAVVAPWAADPRELDVSTAARPPLAPPDRGAWLGTDGGGRSVLVVLLVGARLSVTVGLAAAALAVTLGAVVALLAVEAGRWPGYLLNRVTEWFLALPALPLAMVVAAVLGGGVTTLVVSVALGMWPGVARVTRAQALVVRARPYVERSRALGAGRAHVIRVHLLPGVAPVVASTGVLLVSDAILAAAALTFLGVRVDEAPSWGGMLRDALESGAFSAGAWWYVGAPGCAITALASAVAVCGRHLESRANVGGGAP